MPLLRTGRDRIANLIWGNSTAHWGTSCATIWVAATTVAFDAASTWPVATTGPSTMEAGYPMAGASTNIIEYRGVFGTCCANFAWENWWIHSATASGSGATLNWAAEQALGTKTSAQSWQITTCISITT
jgi:hypothetical protein